MRVWVLFTVAPWLPEPRWTLYQTFHEAVYDAGWLSFGAARRGACITITEAWLSSVEPRGEVVTVSILTEPAEKLPG